MYNSQNSFIILLLDAKIFLRNQDALTDTK